MYNTTAGDPNSAVYYYCSDNLGSIVALVDSSGSVVERYSYDVWGEPTIYDGSGNEITESDVANPFMFTAREVDTLDGGNLKLQHNRHRVYNYKLARWMQNDPLGTVPGGYYNKYGPNGQYKDGINVHNYANNTPIQNLDTFGLYYDDGGHRRIGPSQKNVCCKVKQKIKSQRYVASLMPGTGYPVYHKETQKVSNCFQNTISNPEGKSPQGACECYYAQFGKSAIYEVLKGSHEGECCWCKLFYESVGLGHARLRVLCESIGEEFTLHVYPDVALKPWDNSTIKSGHPDSNDDYPRWAYFTGISSDISCSQAEGLKSLKGQPWFFSVVRIPGVPEAGDGNCHQFASALFGSISAGCP